MFSRVEFFISLRYLRSKNKEKFISIIAIFSLIGIVLGVATLIVVMSVMNGFREDLMNRILGINSHISIYSNEREFKDYNDVIKLIEKDKNVKFVNPIIEDQVMIITNGNTSGCVIKGINEKDLEKKDKIYKNISSIDFKDNFKDNAILLGTSLANQLRVSENDEVKVISPESNSTILGTIPRIKTYKVVGTFSSGMYEYDVGTAFIPLNTAQKHFQYKDSVGGLEIYLNNLNELDKTYNNLQVDLLNNGFYVRLINWKQSNSAFIGALNVERNVMFIILTLIIVVATFNIISSLTMLVNDKSKQIALLRTVGYSKYSIMRIFFLCGTILGVIGTFLGTSLGVLISMNIQNIKIFIEKCFNVELFSPTVYFLTELPSKIMVGDVVSVVCLSLSLSFLSTIYPAFKAARTNPAEILRYE